MLTWLTAFGGRACDPPHGIVDSDSDDEDFPDIAIAIAKQKSQRKWRQHCRLTESVEMWSRRFEQIQDTEHDAEIWSWRFEQKNTSKHLQETEDDHERCLVCLSAAEVQNIKNISKHLQDTEDDHDHERCLGSSGTAYEHDFGSGGQTHVQAQAATTTTTTNNNGRVRDGSSVNVGRFGLGVGKCMSYINVDGFECFRSNANTYTTSTTKRQRRDNDNDDKTARRATFNLKVIFVEIENC